MAADEPVPPTIQEQAADYITQIQTIQPHGPYHLLGWSLGGQIAYETAAQLRARGEEVAILDTAPLPTRDIKAGDIAALLRHHGGLIGGLEGSHLTGLYNYYRAAIPAIAPYDPPPYDRDILLFTATRDLPENHPTAEAWHPYTTGNVHTHPIDCTHTQMADPTPLSHIARFLIPHLSEPI